MSPDGRRLFELGLGPVALAFTAVSSREDIARVRAIISALGERWPEAWLAERGADVSLATAEVPYEDAA